MSTPPPPYAAPAPPASATGRDALALTAIILAAVIVAVTIGRTALTAALINGATDPTAFGIQSLAFVLSLLLLGTATIVVAAIALARRRSRAVVPGVALGVGIAATSGALTGGLSYLTQLIAYGAW